MSDEALRVLCVHGVGHPETGTGWQTEWTSAIDQAVRRWDPQRKVTFDFVRYDDLFEQAPLNPAIVASALFKLGWSGLIYGLGDLFARRRGFGELPERVRWTAGMVAQWADRESLRTACRTRLLKELRGLKPHVICAHSLGSLISYDTFQSPEGAQAIEGRTFISFGSQIGNPFVRAVLAGRIQPFERAHHWYHLFNRYDDIFTAKIRIAAGNFTQVDTPFDLPGFGDHDPAAYLDHANAVDIAWCDIAGGPARRALVKEAVAFRAIQRKPERRALLVGINDYPQKENRLEGCVNDVFLMSAALQECGFLAENIRVVLNERATTAGIMDRLEWLLDHAGPGEQRVLFYSGHGAQIPSYGVGETTDHLDECLVPYDFDWSREHAIIDDAFFDLYSQLPYDTEFVAIFDCCHSGGMTRGNARVRGLTPPDDIRHRQLRWDPEHQMWVERQLPPQNPDLVDKRTRNSYVGESGAAKRLGRAVSLRTLPDRQYDRRRAALGHYGPYLPIIFEACQEAQFALEYRHGVTSYGAFTYSLTRILREHWRAGRRITFQQLHQQTSTVLHDLGYDQTPALIGPRVRLNRPVPLAKLSHR